MSNRNTNNPIIEKKNQLKQSILKGYERFLKIRGTPREIALGFSLGIFIGMSPTMGFQMAIALFFAAMLKWNKLSAVAAVWISNPFTAPIIYSITFLTGAKILGTQLTVSPDAASKTTSFLQFLEKAPEVFWTMTVGGVVIGLPLALISYWVTYSLVEKYQLDIRKKLAAKRERLAERRGYRKERKARRKKRNSQGPR